MTTSTEMIELVMNEVRRWRRRAASVSGFTAWIDMVNGFVSDYGFFRVYSIISRIMPDFFATSSARAIPHGRGR